MTTQVDLRQLQVDRSRETQAKFAPPRKLLTRWGLPLSLLGAFAAVVGWTARASLLPAKRVTVTPVVLTRTEVQQSGTPLFQAAGWIEPRPTPILVSALVEGVIEKLLVVEGQEVQAGEPVALLIDADARLGVGEAEANVSLRAAEVESAKATLAAATKNLEAPLQLEANLAEAQASLAKLATESRNLPFALRGAQARATLARQELERKQMLSDAIAGRTLQQAKSEHDAATATVEELEARAPSLKQELSAWTRRCDALRKQLELKTEEVRQVAEARAGFQASNARLKQASVALEAAQLRLDRMTLRAPVAGRVLALYSQPGKRLMGLNAASERDASSVVGLYDPRRLQVRADVRLEDVPHVQPGQPVQITTASFPTPLSGRVLATTSQADIQKNTLQVKIAIDDPPQVVKPEMLAQVTFLASERSGENPSESQNPLRMLAPRGLIRGTDGGSMVWVADLATSRARLRTVQVGRGSAGALVEITGGLTPLDKLIVGGRENLSDGDRIRITGEDTSIGSDGAAGPSNIATTIAADSDVRNQK